MEHFKPFVHVDIVFWAIAVFSVGLWPWRKKDKEQLAQQESNTETVPQGFFKKRHDKVVAAMQRHYMKEALRSAMRGELHEAIGFFEKAEEVDAKQAPLYYNWGLVLSHLEDYESAIEKYKSALELDQSCVDAVINWGAGLAALGRHEEAIERYQQASDINPDSPCYFNWGCSLASLGRWEESTEKFEKAAQLNQKDAQVHYNWAIALANLGQTEEAKKRLKVFLRFAKGRFKGQVEQARQMLKRN